MNCPARTPLVVHHCGTQPVIIVVKAIPKTMRRAILTAAILILEFAGIPALLAARQPDNQEDLEARISREKKPVKRAKFEVRLAHLRLSQSIEAYTKGRLDDGKKHLDEYQVEIGDAWRDLQLSGQDAVRRPDGFKELEFELRESARRMTDLKQRVSYFNRGPINQVSLQTRNLDAKVIQALFPGSTPEVTQPSSLIPRRKAHPPGVQP